MKTNLFKGRITRKQFLVGLVAHAGLFLVQCIFFFVFIGLRSEPFLRLIPIFLIIVSFLFGMFAGLSIQIRRWHDLDMSGWMVLLGCIPYVNFAVLIALLFLEGKKGHNRFGEASKGEISFSALFPF